MSSDARPPLPTILETIHQQRLKDIEQAKATPGTRPADLEKLLSLNVSPPQIPLVPRLRQVPGRTALMAEVKRASPSKGDIAPDANAAAQALSYALAGASVISVLTEPKWFKGSLLDMRLARQAINFLANRPAILRKDFIVDEYQIMEARLYGADTVLLIVAMLATSRLKALYEFATKKLHMEPLVEVNNAEEMKVALDLGAKVIGVNNRNLHNFEVDMGTTTRLADMVKERDVILCALSGIQSNVDVRSYVEQGVQAVLVGESLMRAADPAAFVRFLLDVPEGQSEYEATPSNNKPLVKISGIKNSEAALNAAKAGADFLGLVFSPRRDNYITVNEAVKITDAIRQYRHSAASPPPMSTTASRDHPENAPWFTLHAARLRKIVSRDAPLVVGIFDGQSLDEILEIVAICRLDLVQLHGAPVQWSKHMPVPVIRGVSITPGDEASSLYDIARPGCNQFLLLEPAARPTNGTGSEKMNGVRTVDWKAVKVVIEQGEIGDATQKLPVFIRDLANEDVGEILRTVNPWAIDGDIGRGAPEQITAFITAIKQ